MFITTQKNAGFTLIEIMVSLALFAVVAVVAIGAFLKIVDANRRADAIESAVNDTNFALDSMVRDLRVGTDYWCVPDGSPDTVITSPSIKTCSLISGNMIEFNSSQTAPKSGGGTCNLVHAYELSGSVIQKAEQTACGASFSFNPVTSTSSGLTVNTFSLEVSGNISSSPEIQPKVFILVSGTAGINQEDITAFTVQTSVSQRIMQ